MASSPTGNGFGYLIRFRLRTLLIVLALGPPMLAVGWWTYSMWRAEQERQRALIDIQPPQASGVWPPLPPLNDPQAIADYEWKLRQDRTLPLIPYVPKPK